MKAVHTKRLLKLARLLMADARNKKGVKFSLSLWATTENSLGIPEVDCGTTACAVGLACISGEFRRAGLSYAMRGSQIIPFYKGRTEWAAVRSFFGLGDSADSYLFSQFSYPRKYRRGATGERYVAKRIREFVKRGGTLPNPLPGYTNDAVW
jgi:hypothetical protein